MNADCVKHNWAPSESNSEPHLAPCPWCERDEARNVAWDLASRIREYRHLKLTDLEKELGMCEADCPWLKEGRR